MILSPRNPEQRSLVQALQIRDQMWCDLKSTIPDLDRLSNDLLRSAKRAQRQGAHEIDLTLSIADVTLLVQILSMSEGELHLRQQGVVV